MLQKNKKVLFSIVALFLSATTTKLQNATLYKTWESSLDDEEPENPISEENFKNLLDEQLGKMDKLNQIYLETLVCNTTIKKMLTFMTATELKNALKTFAANIDIFMTQKNDTKLTLRDISFIVPNTKKADKYGDKPSEMVTITKYLQLETLLKANLSEKVQNLKQEKILTLLDDFIKENQDYSSNEPYLKATVNDKEILEKLTQLTTEQIKQSFSQFNTIIHNCLENPNLSKSSISFCVDCLHIGIVEGSSVIPKKPTEIGEKSPEITVLATRIITIPGDHVTKIVESIKPPAPTQNAAAPIEVDTKTEFLLTENTGIETEVPPTQNAPAITKVYTTPEVAAPTESALTNFFVQKNKFITGGLWLVAAGCIGYQRNPEFFGSQVTNLQNFAAQKFSYLTEQIFKLWGKATPKIDTAVHSTLYATASPYFTPTNGIMVGSLLGLVVAQTAPIQEKHKKALNFLSLAGIGGTATYKASRHLGMRNTYALANSI